MKGQRKDLTGERFGRLVAIKSLKSDNYGHRHWLCRCDCGDLSLVPTYCLTIGRSKSCGCSRKKKPIRTDTNHNKISFYGMTASRRAWANVLGCSPSFLSSKLKAGWSMEAIHNHILLHPERFKK